MGGMLGTVLDPLNLSGQNENGSVLGNALGKPNESTTENATNASANATNTLTGISSDYYNKTANMRSGMIGNLTDFLLGPMTYTESQLPDPNEAGISVWEKWKRQSAIDQNGGNRTVKTGSRSGQMDPTASAMYAPIKNTAEKTYQTGMENLMSKVPNGGALIEGLTNLEGQKASTLTDEIGKIVQDMYNKAFAMSTGSQTATTQGLSNAASNSNSLLNALNQQYASGAQTGTSLVGSLLSYLSA